MWHVAAYAAVLIVGLAVGMAGSAYLLDRCIGRGLRGKWG